MGTHLTLPSRVVSDNQALSDYIHKNPHLLGENVRKYYQSDDLPFLFKVLAVGKALSIQAHPDKELGKKLHKDRPDVYKGTCLSTLLAGSYSWSYRSQSQGPLSSAYPWLSVHV